MARIGYDGVYAVLEGSAEGYLASGNPIDKINCIPAADLTSDMTIFDVRNPPELAMGHIEGVNHVTLTETSKLALEG